MVKTLWGFKLQNTGTGGNALIIRGIGTTATRVNSDPKASFYVDDMYIGRPEGNQLFLYDLEEASECFFIRRHGIQCWLSPFLCVAGIGIYAPLGIWWSLPASFLSGTAAVGAAGLMNSFGNLGGFFGPYITGLLKELTGDYTAAWIILSGFMCGAALLVLRLQSKRPQIQSS